MPDSEAALPSLPARKYTHPMPPKDGIRSLFRPVGNVPGPIPPRAASVRLPWTSWKYIGQPAAEEWRLFMKTNFTQPGSMPMPPDFQYRDVHRKGRPQHGKSDNFQLRHPPMNRGRRAKLFSPFDALKGFSEAIESVAEQGAVPENHPDRAAL